MKSNKPTPRAPGVRRIPQGSLFYTRIIPLLLILFGVVLVAIILFSFGLVFGLVRVP